MSDEDQPWQFRAGIDHPDARGRAQGEHSRVMVQVNRRLKSGRIDMQEISVADALSLAEGLLRCANIAITNGAATNTPGETERPEK